MAEDNDSDSVFERFLHLARRLATSSVEMDNWAPLVLLPNLEPWTSLVDSRIRSPSVNSKVERGIVRALVMLPYALVLPLFVASFAKATATQRRHVTVQLLCEFAHVGLRGFHALVQQLSESAHADLRGFRAIQPRCESAHQGS